MSREVEISSSRRLSKKVRRLEEQTNRIRKNILKEMDQTRPLL